MRFLRIAQDETPDRRGIASALKGLGLPATGTTANMAKMLEIASKSPKEWTREEFDFIVPYIYIHQGFGRHDDDTAKSIMGEEGLQKGMVDNLGNIVRGQWSFARRLVGGHAYLFWPGHLNWKGDSGRLNQSKAFYHFVSVNGQDPYDAIISG